MHFLKREGNTGNFLLLAKTINSIIRLRKLFFSFTISTFSFKINWFTKITFVLARTSNVTYILVLLRRLKAISNYCKVTERLISVKSTTTIQVLYSLIKAV